MRRAVSAVGAITFTLLLFLVLPLMQTITKPPENSDVLQDINTARLEPPPEVQEEEEPEEEPEEEEEPPELQEEEQLLDLTQIELALNPGAGGLPGGDFTVDLGAGAAEGGSIEDLFSISELDQKPRVLYQASPVFDARMRKKAPATVVILFIVNERGRVENPIVKSPPDPVFDPPALAAIKKWKFEPGKRNGEPVRFRMRVPITFPKG